VLMVLYDVDQHYEPINTTSNLIFTIKSNQNVTLLSEFDFLKHLHLPCGDRQDAM
jgi:hypothetical protein